MAKISQKSDDDTDYLKLATNTVANIMLQKAGDNSPLPEKVILSVRLTKINKRDEEQERVLLLTDKALYNLVPKNYNKCIRRIDFKKIVSLTVSTTSNDFAIHVPEEYDYRYKSDKQAKIAEVLSSLYEKKEGKKLSKKNIAVDTLKQSIINKDQAKLQTREQRLERYRELIAKSNYDDEVEDAKNAKVQKQLIKTKDKVKPDDFEFLKVIGRGSFGKVMQVRKKDTKEIFAMKILKKKALIAKNQVEHTNAERKILQSLQHPFLMHLRYAFQTEAKLYFVLDYYRGGELFFHLKKKRRFSEEQARLFVAEVALAIGHLHGLDVVYRDLKPENILLDHTGHVCLTDFGLSKDVGPEQKDTHTFCGTPEYLAPEIIMNLGHGKAVDWWSLGILLYELTVGIPPFHSQNVNEMYRKIQKAPLLFPPNLSNACKDLITKLLERDPIKRLGSSGKDVDTILSHSFFKGLDIQKLLKKDIKPAYVPKTMGIDDTSQFDKQFSSEKVVDSHAPKPNLADDGFGGFTFVPKKGAIAADNDDDMGLPGKKKPAY